MELKLLRLFQPKNPDKPLGGRYKIISQLGVGGFGHTFVAVDLHLPGHPQCVVKQLKPKVSDANSLQTARRLFDIEAKVLYQLGNHDQIPRLLAHFEDNKEFYLAQELIEGKPLNEELVASQPWSEARVIALLQDMLCVLAFVHQQHVIHRDIKPSNLIRRQHDGRIVLIDFGAVKQASVQIVNPKSGQTHTISIGTQGYTPKEQLGGNPRFSSDIYAAGMVGIQALTGVNPRYLKEDPQTGEINWRDRAPQVSPELAAILECMVRYDFRTRYPTATEALAALRCLPTAIAQSLPLPQQPLEGTETLPSQVLELPPRTATDPTGGMEQTESARSQPASSSTSATGSASTNIWTPTEIPVQSHSALSSTGSMEPPINLQPTQQLGSGRRTVVVPTILNRRRPITLWSILAALSAAGMSFFIARVTLFAQPSGQIADHSSVSVPSPAPSTEESASPSPIVSSVSSPIVNPREESVPSPITPTISPSAESVSPSPASSPSVNPSPKPVPPSPASSPSVNPSPKPVPPSPISSPVPILNKKPTQPSPASPPAATPAPPKQVPSTTTSTTSSSKARVTKLMRQANHLREAKQYQKAVDLYNQLIAIKPDIAEAHWGRCYSLNSIQQPEEAIAACNRALAINPSYPEALWSKGTALDQQQRHPDALKLYEQATALKPDFADAWNNQGVSLFGLGRYSEAITAFDKATALKPGFADAWANRGAALWEQKRFNAAIASLDKALQIDPNNQNATNLRQQVREKLGR